MTSGLALGVSLILSQVGPPGASVEGIAPLRYALTALDYMFAAAGVVLLGWLGYRWRGRAARAVLGSPPPRPNAFQEKSLLIPILAYVAGAVVCSNLVRLMAGERGADLEWISGTGAQVFGIGAVLAVAHHSYRGGASTFLGLHGAPKRRWLGFAADAAICAIGLCPVLAKLTWEGLSRLLPGVEYSVHPTIEALRTGELAWDRTVGLWLSAAVVAPFAEEIFFRGIVQTTLVNLLGSRWFAITAAAAAFALVHHSQPYALPALFALGVILGVLYERSGILLVPIGVHAAFNLKTLIWISLGAEVG